MIDWLAILATPNRKWCIKLVLQKWSIKQSTYIRSSKEIAMMLSDLWWKDVWW